MDKRFIKKTLTVFSAIAVIALVILSITNKNGYAALYAHSIQLNVEYDACVPDHYYSSVDIGDGEDEKWYELIHTWEDTSGIFHRSYHLPHSSNGVSTIKYYISPNGKNNSNVYWNSYLSNSDAEYVKTAYVNSIKKWNNVYFYKYDSAGMITKQRLVNIIEGTSDDNDIVIYPEYNNSNSSSYASTGAVWSNNAFVHYVETVNGVDHYHCDKWEMSFNLYYHNPSLSTYDYLESSHELNRTGAHGLGHVLGLSDIDSCEAINQNTSSYHHEELLMGYSDGSVLTRQSEITYKDLVGAAITRGLHTDDDHSWIYDYTSSSEGNRKLICSICNGVRYVDSLVGYDYVTYKGCNNLHNLSSGKMFPVASYGNKDYYKCKYCRYVAPFTSLVDQDYVATDHYNSTYHIVTNQVNGLSYSCLDEHTFDSNGVCTGCSQISSHSFNSNYVYYTSNTHKAYCTCGTYILKLHAIDGTRTYTFHGHLYGPCIDCGAIIDLGGEGPIIPVPNIINQMVTDNGSFIMESGIYYIVEEDLEAYINGTLIFHLIGEVSN